MSLTDWSVDLWQTCEAARNGIINKFQYFFKISIAFDSVNCSSEKYEQTSSLKVLRLKSFTSIAYFSFLYYLVSLIGYRTRYRNTLFNHAVVPLL